MLLGLIGNPVSMSWSDMLFNTIFRLEDSGNLYLAANVAPESVPSLLNIKLCPFDAFNVTAPYKETVLLNIPDRMPAVWKIGSTNLVVRNKESFMAHNTDYYGFLKTLIKNDVSIDGKDVAICGTGGVARTVLYSILTEFSPESVHILSRNPASAVKRFSGTSMFSSIKVGGYDEKNDFDVIVNCTSIGMRRDDPSPVGSGRFRKGSIAIDLTYQNPVTAFMKNAIEKGGMGINGRDMFFAQAMETYRIVFGGYPKKDIFRKAEEAVISWAEEKLP